MPVIPIRERNPLNLLIEVRQQFTQRVPAQKLSVTARTISRWENRQTQIPLFVEPALREILRSGPERPEGTASFTFVDLFAGLGG
jgi:DNA (cytosine-5)-methyltransferase 1